MNRLIAPILITLCWLVLSCQTQSSSGYQISNAAIKQTIDVLVEKYGSANRERIETGVNQVSAQWRKADGSTQDFREFCLENIIADTEILDLSLSRLEASLENISGHLTEMGRELRWHLDVNTGPLLPIDYLLGNLNLDSHLNDDLYTTKVAFWVLLNYPVHVLDECLAQGENWSRQKWAEVRLAQRFAVRVPAEVSQAIHDAYITGDNYISGYNIYLGNLLTEDGRRLFPRDLRLISHWGIRDELKAQYALDGGLERQRMIYQLMERIIRQEVPQVVIDNPDVDWIVAANTVRGASTDNTPEPDTRYRHLGNFYRAVKLADPYYSDYPTFVERSFNLMREIPEESVRKLFTELLSSDEFRWIGGLIQQRLGRELEPFDIWYKGFRSHTTPDETKLDKITALKYPTAEAFRADIPDFLIRLGFDYSTAQFLHSKIEVDAARGVGHAMGAGRRSDNAHLRTRVSEGGLDYKGYNIAIHELGHNVEQVFSLNRIDHTLLQGVPNTAFTEAFAFIFQSRDLDLLGYEQPLSDTPDYSALHRLWSVCEIGAVALVDMDVWHWMYDHPDFTPAELKAAVIEIAQSIWNEFFYPVLGHRDAPILAIYSHMIDNGLYLPNYPLGHIIEFQIEEYMHGKNLGREMERMCTIGNVTPKLWMELAVGSPISVQPILNVAREVLDNSAR